MPKIVYSCAYCAKKKSLDTLELGQAFICPKCHQCQVIPSSFAVFPRKHGGLFSVLFGFLFLSAGILLISRLDLPRLDKLQKKAEREAYYGNYTNAIEYYFLMKRECEIQENSELAETLDSKIQELQELQKQKNSSEQKKILPPAKKDFQNTQK
ncbi:MAG: hypothetical protein AABZ60_11720 [Planctomycetota bacterium]|mgnify:CR=1 FL=1